MSFDHAFAALEPRLQVVVNAVLAKLATDANDGARIAANVQSEYHLPRDEMQRILSCLANCLKNPHADVDSIKKDFVDCCRTMKLKGPPIRGQRPEALARVVSESTFCHLAAHAHPGLSPSVVRSWLQSCAAQTNVVLLRNRFAEVPLGRHLIWATFAPDPRTPLQDTFFRSAKETRDALSLPPANCRPPLYVFIYTPLASLSLHIPTISDAEWEPRFAPSPPHAVHGLTSATPPQPEVVHANVTGRDVCRPIHIAR